MNIYITGIAGFLGSHLAEALSTKGHLVSGCDNLSAGEEKNVPSYIFWDRMDCRDPDLRGRLDGVDVLYHTAAHPHEGLSVFSPRTIGSSIFDVSMAVIGSAISAGVKRIVFCSSMSRYGDHMVPFTEGMEPRPRDPYAIAKVAVEQVLRELAIAHGFEYVIAVPHNIVGPRQKYNDPFRNVAAIMANRILSGAQPIVYGNGKQTRCFSDIRDVLPALIQMATREGISGQVFNVGPDEEVVTIEELGQRLAWVIGVEWDPLRLADRPLEVKHAHCSSDKIRDYFNYRTTFTLEETLKSLTDYIKARGVKPFDYYLPLEIINEKTPKFWTGEIR